MYTAVPYLNTTVKRENDMVTGERWFPYYIIYMEKYTSAVGMWVYDLPYSKARLLEVADRSATSRSLAYREDSGYELGGYMDITSLIQNIQIVEAARVNRDEDSNKPWE